MIDAPAVDVEQIVQITASDAIFGRLNHGFMIHAVLHGIAIIAGRA